MADMFKVGLSHDLWAADGPTSWGDIGLAELDAAGVSWEFLPADDGALTAAQVDGYDAVLFAAPAVTAETVSGDRPPRLFARFGVGLDAVDLHACTTSGVAVTITPDGARRAVATAALTLILAVGHNLLRKDLLVRESRWDDKFSLMGRGLTGRRVGTLGFGNIAVELFDLLKPFGTHNYTADPYRDAADTAAQGVTLVSTEELLKTCDIVVITSALTPETHHVINRERLALMHRDSILINVSRGAIVDTDALTDALATGQIAGAGLDVFDPEPLPAGHPLLDMDNVVLSPHALAWTDEMAMGNGSSAVAAILAIRDGKRPIYLANPAVMNHDRFLHRTREGDR
jgi:phosphoglycerate dehydrogenase-like enzyme